jgi:hypothetical protein
MKILALLVSLSLSVNLNSQVLKFDDIPKNILENLNKMGVEDCLLLNEHESNYFNSIFKNSRKDFDFTGKKIGFITGSSGNTLSNKKEYFHSEKDRFNHGYSPNNGVLYIFNEKQKEESGGYYAAIIYWSKTLVSVESVVKTLKKGDKGSVP